MKCYRSQLLLGVLLIFLAGSSYAANFRCDGRFVDGFTKFDLLSSCGEPAYKDSYSKLANYSKDPERNYGGCERVDQWYYVNSETKTSYMLEIERGIVKRVLRSRARKLRY